MRALSLKQPWAQLVVDGRKKIELRKWNTNFRGRFLIHASKVPDFDAMKRFGFDNLPLGQIVGKANLVEVKHYLKKSEFKDDKNLHLATSDWGEYGFMLDNIEKVKPIEAKGQLGFWDFKNNI